jgi:hypothetical protein
VDLMRRGLALALVLLACGPGTGSDTSSDTSTGPTASTAASTVTTTDPTSTTSAADTVATADATGILGTSGTASTTTDATTTDAPGTTGTSSTATDATGTTDDLEGCHDDAECEPNECMQPWDAVCPQCIHVFPSCAIDRDCPFGFICVDEFIDCACDSPFTTACIPVCESPEDCEPGETCESGHCSLDTCTLDRDCEANFRCEKTPYGMQCRRRPCDANFPCDGGLCIDGWCHATPGTCVTRTD